MRNDKIYAKKGEMKTIKNKKNLKSNVSTCKLGNYKFTLNSVSSTAVNKHSQNLTMIYLLFFYYQNIKIGIQRIHEWAKYNDRIAILRPGLISHFTCAESN